MPRPGAPRLPDGDTVTPDGQRLGRLYTELDLLAAECLRRGLWDGLDPAELAACVCALSFESRQDDVQPPRLPNARVSPALAAMTRTWGELDQLEKDHDLSFLREPDLGFSWAAYRWARGARLESVLDESPDLKLDAGTYRPQPVRRVMIPKPSGGQRKLE